MLQSLAETAQDGLTTAVKPETDLPLEWRSCKAAASLLNLLACLKERLHEAVKYQSQSLDGLPKLSDIRGTPSASFPRAYAKAKQLTCGEQKITTVINVSLLDVHIFELAARGQAGPYTSFAHTFTVGVGPEGVVIWQSWGEYGYALDEYVKRGGARVRIWQEAGDFVDRFEKLTRLKGSWDAKRNKLYQQCFEVDIIKICGTKGPSRPIVPKYEAWVRQMIFENVKLADIYKFTFK